MKIDRLLAEHQLLVTTAESCTGGLVASALVDIPGISDYFKEGYHLCSRSKRKDTGRIAGDHFRLWCRE